MNEESAAFATAHVGGFAPGYIDELYRRGLTPADAQELAFELDVAGYDSADPLVMTAAKRALDNLRRRDRSAESVLARWKLTRLTDGDLAEVLELPRSTVQAITAGRMAESLTPKQKKALTALFSKSVAVLDELVCELTELKEKTHD